jgi:hypothetical protein
VKQIVSWLIWPLFRFRHALFAVRDQRFLLHLSVKSCPAAVDIRPATTEAFSLALAQPWECMKTDSLFYKLFQQFPDTLFALTGQSSALVATYSFDSVAVKETTFTMDGIFVPQTPELPLYFVEAQLQKDPDLCSRMLTEIMLYLRHHPPRRNWQAVIIVPTRRHAPELEEAYAMFASHLTIITLKDLSESENIGVE